MAFPDLVLDIGNVLHSQKIGVPVNGHNTFDLSFSLTHLYGDRRYLVQENPDQLVIEVVPLGPLFTVMGATLVKVVKTKATVNFVQTGIGSCLVMATIKHSVIR
jgi:hypothetical protein